MMKIFVSDRKTSGEHKLTVGGLRSCPPLGRARVRAKQAAITDRIRFKETNDEDLCFEFWFVHRRSTSSTAVPRLRRCGSSTNSKGAEKGLWDRRDAQGRSEEERR